MQIKISDLISVYETLPSQAQQDFLIAMKIVANVLSVKS